MRQDTQILELTPEEAEEDASEEAAQPRHTTSAEPEPVKAQNAELTKANMEEKVEHPDTQPKAPNTLRRSEEQAPQSLENFAL